MFSRVDRYTGHIRRLSLSGQLRHIRHPLLVHIPGGQKLVEQPFVPVRPVDRDLLLNGCSSQLVSDRCAGGV